MEARTAKRKAALRSFYGAVSSGHIDAVRDLFASSYVPHVPVFRTTRLDSGLDALMQRFQRAGRIASELKRVIGDGELVFAHVKYPGRIPVAGVDIFRVDEHGRMVEHWDVLEMASEPLPDESTLF